MWIIRWKSQVGRLLSHLPRQRPAEGLISRAASPESVKPKAPLASAQLQTQPVGFPTSGLICWSFSRVLTQNSVCISLFVDCILEFSVFSSCCRIFFGCIYLCVLGVYTHMTQAICWRSEDILWESVRSVYRWSWRPSLEHQAWPQAPSPQEPSHQPISLG